MALRKKLLDKKNVDNTGFTTSGNPRSSRFINKDGTTNVVNVASMFSDRYSWYNFLINLPNWKFILLIFGFYTFINFLFALIYYFFCVPHLQGLVVGTPWETFEEVYFFSSQTLTTVGYGRISPIGLVTNTVASLEAFIGILTLAIITGLLYGRFVKPKAYISFSDIAVFAPFQGGKALMFRLAPIKNATLSDVSVKVNVAMLVDENGKMVNKYYSLPLQFDNINSLYLSWTVVHPLDEKSPLWGLSMQDLADADFEMMIYVKAYDEDFSNNVVARTSYTYDEIVNGARFVPVFHESPDGKGTIVDMKKMNVTSPAEEAAI